MILRGLKLFAAFIMLAFVLSSCGGYPTVSDRMDGKSFVRETVPRALYASDYFFRKFDKRVKEDSQYIKFYFTARNAGVMNKFKFSTPKREFLLALLEDYEQELKKLSAEADGYKPKSDELYVKMNFRYTKVVRAAALFAGLEQLPKEFRGNLRRYYFWLAKTERFNTATVKALHKELPLKKGQWRQLILKLF